MKAINTVIFLVSTFFLTLQSTQAAVYISNLGETSLGAYSFSQNGPNGPENLWFAQRFYTGTALGGYNLDSIELSLDGTGSPAGSVVVYLYGSTPSAPGAPEQTVNSVNPTVSGTYTFTASGIILSPSTYYYIVATTTADPATDPYAWNQSSTYNFTSTDNWSIPQNHQCVSTDGSHWIYSFISANPLQFAVNATAVPEPGILSLTGIGLALAFFRRRK